MGNLCPPQICPPYLAKASVISMGVAPDMDDTTTLPTMPPPKARRFGIEGLQDCGLEYRLVKCDSKAHEKDNDDNCNSSGNDDDNDPPETAKVKSVCWDCRTRLCHMGSKEIVTAENRKRYITDGANFDEVAACCQEICQERLTTKGGEYYGVALEWVEIPATEDGAKPAIQALVSPDYKDGRPLLVVITGRGKSRAGNLSVKHLMISGMEHASALYHIVQAQNKGWGVIILDPNAYPNGMEIITRSLDHILPTLPAATDGIQTPFYILAHSAAGGQIVRYLNEGSARKVLRSNLDKLVFTDSTHNLQWIKDDTTLCRILQSKDRALYVRNCSENPSDTFACHRDKKAGEPCEGNVWWKRRFGEIPTVWAGTTDHSYMCWVAREVIWDFFTSTSKELLMQ